MDKVISKKSFFKNHFKSIVFFSALALIFIYLLYTSDQRSRLTVSKKNLIIGTVVRNTFQEYIPLTGNVIPVNSVFIDAIEGGNIQQIYKESGTYVNEGESILTLLNLNLQLDVMNREAQFYQQINTLRQTRLLIEQNNLNLKGQLEEMDFRLNILKPQHQRYQQLYDKKMISQKELDDLKEEYDYYIKKKKLTYSSYMKDSIARIDQLNQLEQSEDRMQKSLDAVKRILDNLTVKAPIAGQLSLSDLQIGKSVNKGARLGQVDIVGKFKLRAEINEHYLYRIKQSQKAVCKLEDKSYTLSVDKIYPEITNGKFEVDLTFLETPPVDIKRGQSIPLKLELSQSILATLLQTGGFTKNTGGSWAYVVSPDGETAVKKEIRLGRKNSQYHEVLSGLEIGDKVITSFYENFKENEVLILNNE